MRTSLGPILANTQAVLVLVLFMVILMMYLMVWYKLVKFSKTKSTSSGVGMKSKYDSAARIMMLFVAAFLVQWWPAILFGTWSVFELAHVSVAVLVVLFCNCGGVYNFVAYTVMRKKYQRVGTTQDKQTTKSTVTGQQDQQTNASSYTGQ